MILKDLECLAVDIPLELGQNAFVRYDILEE